MSRNMIVGQQPDAVEVGARLFMAGGNAVDAAIGCAFAQSVIDQMMCGIGGYGVMQVYAPQQKAHEAITFLAQAPAAVREGMWADLLEYETRDGFGFVLKGRVNEVGYQAVCTPGSVRGFHNAHARYGRLAWKDVIRPAIRLAAEGYRVQAFEHQYRSVPDAIGRLDTNTKLAFSKNYRHLFFNGEGQPRRGGDLVKNPDLAGTLTLIAEQGPDVFYTGAIAERIDADMRAHGGFLAKSDLAEYRVEVEAPVWGEYRGLEIAAAPAPSSGPALIRMLQTLEHFDLRSLGHNTPDYIRIVAEAMKRAQAIKEEVIGDPRQMEVPVEAIVSKAAAAADAAAIKRGEKAHIERAKLKEPAETTHLGAIDRDGMCVVLTHTNGMQSGVISDGLGFMYNGQIGSYDPRPGRTQSLVPGRRRVTSMAPSILFRDGKPYMLIGAPGGSNIPMALLQAIVNVVDFGMTVGDAVSAPRFSATSDLVDVSARIPTYVCEALAKMGYGTARSAQSYTNARVHAILIDGDRIEGGADPAGGGMALAV